MAFANGWGGRIRVYLRERYPPVPYLIASAISTAAMLSLWLRIHPERSISFPLALLLCFNAFTFPFLMRVCDEVKDLDSDRKNCPERCIPRGAVKIEDVTFLGRIFLGLYLAANVAWIVSSGGSPLLFLGLLFYLFLFLKYFFLRRLVSGYLLVALVISNPLVWLACFYNLSLLNGGRAPLSARELLVSVVLWAPSWTWEIARKVRIRADETEYQTYSAVLGPRLSCLPPFLGAALICYGLSELAQGLPFYAPYSLVALVACLAYGIFLLRFVLNPTSEQSRKFQPATEALIVVFSLLEIYLYPAGFLWK